MAAFLNYIAAAWVDGGSIIENRNLPTAGTDYHVPFGGIRPSSYGPHEQGQSAAEFYTQVKTSYIHPGEVI